MPVYVYSCDNCGISIEKIESVKAPEVQPCNKCGNSDSLKRQIAQSSFNLSGVGWFKDGYTKN